MTALVKGSHVAFELENHRIVRCPARYGMIHDPEGTHLPRCDVFVAPFRLQQRQGVELSAAARAYFGGSYPGVLVTIAPIPDGGWRYLGRVVQIFYTRPGRTVSAKHTGKYFHPFHKQTWWQRTFHESGNKEALKHPVDLYRSGRIYRLVLPNGCVVNERGFVWP